MQPRSRSPSGRHPTVCSARSVHCPLQPEGVPSPNAFAEELERKNNKLDAQARELDVLRRALSRQSRCLPQPSLLGAANIGKIMSVELAKLRYTQKTCSSTFSCGRHVIDTARDIEANPEALISNNFMILNAVYVQQSNVFMSLNNRRLYAFRWAEQRWVERPRGTRFWVQIRLRAIVAAFASGCAPDCSRAAALRIENAKIVFKICEP